MTDIGRGDWPVFVFPEALHFNQQDPKLVLTVFNPYEFPIIFKSKSPWQLINQSEDVGVLRLVLCSAPQKYAVVEAEGSVRPQSCVDM